MSFIKKYIYHLLLLLILIFVTIKLFSNISTLPLDIDELFTLNILYMDNLREIILLGNIFDTHPPLYHLIMYFFTQIFGLSEYVIRIPSVIFTVISFYLVFVLAKKLFSPIHGLTASIVTIILIPNPWITYFARGYSLLLLFSILTMISLVNIINYKINYKEKDVTFTLLFYFIISSLLCMYTHYFGCILVLSELLFLFFFFHKTVIKELIAIVLFLIILYGPWLQISVPKKATLTDPNFVNWINWNVFGNYNPYILISLVVIAIIYHLYILIKQKHDKQKSNYPFFLILYLFLFPFLLTFFIDKFIIRCYQHKYLIISLIPFYILVADTFVIFLKNKINIFLTLIIFCLLSKQTAVPPDVLPQYYLDFVINNHNKTGKPIVIIIDKHNKFIEYYKYHFDKYAIFENMSFVYDFNEKEIIKETDKLIGKNNGQYIWLFDSTSIYDIKPISDNKQVIVFNKESPSVYLVK